MYTQIPTDEYNSCSSLSHAIYWSNKNDLETLDFNDVIWDHDIPTLIEILNKHQISQFTISVRQAGIQETISNLINQGCHLVGMVEVQEKSFNTLLPAFVMTL